MKTRSKYIAPVIAYLRARPQGATVKEISLDLELPDNTAYRVLNSLPQVWVDHWVTAPDGGMPSAVYRIVPEDAPRPKKRRAK